MKNAKRVNTNFPLEVLMELPVVLEDKAVPIPPFLFTGQAIWLLFLSIPSVEYVCMLFPFASLLNWDLKKSFVGHAVMKFAVFLVAHAL